MVWGKDTFNLLGINFSVDLDLVVNLNYEPILDDINKSLNVWKKKIPYTSGKNHCDKNTYLIQVKSFVYVHPKSRLKCYKQIAVYFLKIYMDGKPDKINRKQLVCDYMKGGLCMIDLEKFICSLKCTWIRRLLTQKQSPWYELCLYNLKDYEKCINLHSLWHKTLARKTTKKFTEILIFC